MDSVLEPEILRQEVWWMITQEILLIFASEEF